MFSFKDLLWRMKFYKYQLREIFKTWCCVYKTKLCNNMKSPYYVTFPPFFNDTSVSHISQRIMLLTVSPLRWKVGEFYTSRKSWILFSFCTKQVLFISKIVLAWGSNGLNRIGMYISCNSRPCETLKLLHSHTQISPSFAPLSLYWLPSFRSPHDSWWLLKL